MPDMSRFSPNRNILSGLRLGEFALSLLTVLVLAGLIVYPLLAIMVQSVVPGLFDAHPDLTPTLANLRALITERSNAQAVLNSAGMGLAVAVGATLIGVPLAVLTTRTNVPMRRVMDALVWVVFFTPSFVMASSWLVLVSTGGIIDQIHRMPPIVANTFFGLGGVIFILSLKLFPFVYLSARAGLGGLGSEFSDAARTLGAGPFRAFLRIDLPLLLPAVLAGAIIAFAEALSDFGTVATIAQQSSFPLLTYQIYTAIDTAPVNFPLAAAFGLLLIVIIGAAMVGQSLLLKGRGYRVISGRSRPAHRVDLGRWAGVGLLFCGLVFAFALFLPLAGAIVSSSMIAIVNGFVASNFSSQNFSDALAVGSANVAALERSMIIALICATVVSLIALPLAFTLERGDMRGGRLLNLVTLTTIAVPGIVLAAGYIFAWNQQWQTRVGLHLYGTIQLLVLALIAGALPYAVRLYAGSLAQIGDSVMDAARVQGAGIWTTLGRIVFPMLRKQVGSIWMLVFTGAMFELAAAELLYPPGQPTMPVEILALLDNFRTGAAMALTILAIAALAVTLVVARFLLWILNISLWRQVAAARAKRQQAFHHVAEQTHA